jgi:hypothetical protein
MKSGDIMRWGYTVALMTLALGATSGAAQTPERESAVGPHLSGYGGFIGLDTRFGDMMDEFAVFMGGHAAVLLKHRVYLGVSGAGLVSDSRVSTASPAIDMGYGGVLVGYVIAMPSLVQFTAEAMLGAGGVKLADITTDEEWDPLFVFEPAVGAEIKLARVVRIGLGAGYRFVGAVDTEGLRDGDLRGVIGTATIRLGWF